MKTNYSIGEDNKTLIAKRSFTAPLEKVWHAWTTSEQLDLWWGPLPYRAITQSFSFTPGGEWLYIMQGPEGDKHYCKNVYLSIEPHVQFTAEDHFCNEDWSVNTAMPSNNWQVVFSFADGVTTVIATTRYATAADLETVTQMGMKEGFDMGLNQLEALLTS